MIGLKRGAAEGARAAKNGRRWSGEGGRWKGDAECGKAAGGDMTAEDGEGQEGGRRRVSWRREGGGRRWTGKEGRGGR